MPVDSTHNEYDAQFDAWKQVGDCLTGPRAIKFAGEDYLPKLEGQTPEAYEAYQKRSIFFNGTRKALSAWIGMVFRKPVQIKKPPKLGFLDQDADLQGNPLGQYIEDLAHQVFSKGRRGTLIDWSEEEGRAYVATYDAEQIINWDVGRVDGRKRLTRLTLHEISNDWIDFTGAPEEGDEFEQQEIDQWRVYRLVNVGADGAKPIFSVFVTVYRKSADGEFVEVEVRVPSRRGIGLPAIPFVFHNATDEDPEVGEVPLENLTHINIAHYQVSADLGNGVHIAGTPTPWARGFTDENNPTLTLGSSEAWVTDAAYAECGFLEFTGQGLGALEKRLSELEEMMGKLGVQSLMPESGDAEAFETVKMRGTAEAASLVVMAKSVGRGTTDVLKWISWWYGTAPTPMAITDIEVEVNTDFLTSLIDPGMLTALTTAYLGGAISFETYFTRLQGGEVYGEMMTIEKEREAIRAGILLPEPRGANPPAIDV